MNDSSHPDPDLPVAYTVACTFENEEVAERWLAWLSDEHLAEVCAAGALSAYAVRMHETPIRCEARYLFSDLAAFRRYEEKEAPRLREEGLARFPLDLGLSYSRSVGTLAAEVSV